MHSTNKSFHYDATCYDAPITILSPLCIDSYLATTTTTERLQRVFLAPASSYEKDIYADELYEKLLSVEAVLEQGVEYEYEYE